MSKKNQLVNQKRRQLVEETVILESSIGGSFCPQQASTLEIEVDQDSDGRISFKEFESAMKYGQDEVSPAYFA
ncbi:ef-hand calcium-binding domain-containing protein 11 isoform x2 [Limosa lapponica baueri]|uniref:Ef-hand calcium-binding domain-containing protein 11 isoform x2 n=1 Tax=Limosa lapponica baueri TaxID=1758121 RepID=A0A2I0TM32_LIMLA|nr:ef-hand calcium-binding domain-containing protein 11 isoform x2 [Limosa lapponica baueri]